MRKREGDRLRPLIRACLNRFDTHKWQFEARTLTLIRAALCLRGYSWGRAQITARELVDVGLLDIGATHRPSYPEGQPGYCDSRDTRIDCEACGKPLHVSRLRFCSERCRTTTYARQWRQGFSPEHSMPLRGRTLSEIRATCAKRREPRPCGWCGTVFAPPGRPDSPGRFCSRACAARANAAAKRAARKPTAGSRDA